MKEFTIEVVFQNHIIGTAPVDLSPYLSTPQKLILIEGPFQIINDHRIGELDIVMKTNFETWKSVLENASSPSVRAGV